MEKDKDLETVVEGALANDTKLRKFIDSIYMLINQGAVILGGRVGEGSLQGSPNKIVSVTSGAKPVVKDIKVDPVQQHARVGVQIDWAKGRMALR